MINPQRKWKFVIMALWMNLNILIKMDKRNFKKNYRIFMN